MNIAVLGMGYVGTVTAACLAKLGHTVLGVDIDQRKVDAINNGKAPSFEPGLDELVAEQVQAKRLQATMKVEDINICEVVIICVGTPALSNGDVDISILNRALTSIQPLLHDETKTIVIRSTVPPGTCFGIQHQSGVEATILFCPEFLREGLAIDDFENPSLSVIGYNEIDRPANKVYIVETLLSANSGSRLVEYSTAEMLKYACNAFHALKICFANEIEAIANMWQADGRVVMELLASDKKLNASKAYLRPGFAYGGACLPKDLKALNFMAREANVFPRLIDAIEESNNEQIERAVALITESGFLKLGIIGLAFKENTDDIRESPTLALIDKLSENGTPDIRVYAPCSDEAKYKYLPQIVKDAIRTKIENVLEDRDMIILMYKLTDDVVIKAVASFKRAKLDLSGHYQTVL